MQIRNSKYSNTLMLWSMVVLCFLAMSCDSLRSPVYDQYAYTKAVEVKVEASGLMEKAGESFPKYQDQVASLLLEIEKIKLYEQHRPNNEISVAMWELLSDEERNLLAGFFRRWEEKETLSPFFIEEARKQIDEALELLIEFEAKKEVRTKANLIAFISNNT